MNSQIFEQKWKNFNLYNRPKIYQAKNKDSQPNEYFSSILRNVFQEFSRMPNFKPLKQNLIVSMNVTFLKILSQNNKKILTANQNGNFF